MGKNVKNCNGFIEQLQSGMSKTNGLGTGFGTPFQWYPLSGPFSKGLYMVTTALVAVSIYLVQFVRTSAAKSQPTVLLVFLY